MPEEAVWSLGFDKDSNRSQREKFSVYLERVFIMGSLKLVSAKMQTMKNAFYFI